MSHPDNGNEINYNEFDDPNPELQTLLDNLVTPFITVDGYLGRWKEMEPEKIEEIFLSWLESSVPGVKTHAMSVFEGLYKKYESGERKYPPLTDTVQRAQESLVKQHDYAKRAKDGNLTQEELEMRNALSVWFGTRWPFNLDDEPNWDPYNHRNITTEIESINKLVVDPDKRQTEIQEQLNFEAGLWTTQKVVSAMKECDIYWSNWEEEHTSQVEVKPIKSPASTEKPQQRVPKRPSLPQHLLERFAQRAEDDRGEE